MKWKKILLHPRIIFLLIVLLLSLVAISPQLDGDGVAIRQVMKESAAALAGFESPDATVQPTHRERIISVAGTPIKTVLDYHAAVQALVPNQTITIQSDKATYRLVTLAESYVNASNVTVVTGMQDLGLVVYEAPSSNIRKGLDLSGGTRVVLQPKTQIAQEDLDLVIDNIKQRLNVFGLSDIIVRPAKDLAGTDFIVVEIAGANQDEVRELLANQGVFRAQVNNISVFTGGEDVTFVCRSPECSGIDSRQGGCGPASAGGFICPFSFSISLSDNAAKQQAAVTKDLQIISNDGGAYLSAPLELILDGEVIDSLNIAADLQGRAVNDIQISGSGVGASQALALEDALASMKQLQTILITGSLPVELEIVKADAISPILGKEFVNNAIIMAFAAILAVAATIFVFYRRLLVSIPMVFTMVSEGVIILGFAALVGWNLDLAAIAGIIIAIGTGVDDQIVIIDETLRDKSGAYRSWKDRLKNAFFIIMAAYFTTVVAMLPLWFAGAGILRGFALTTIAGVTIGVFITRPAFAAATEILLKKEE